MNKKLRTIVAGAIMFTLTSSLFIGCNKSKDTSRTEGGKVKLELFSNKQESKTLLQNLANDFTKENPNIQITVNVPPEAETVIKTRLTKNDMPDILSIGGNATYGELARAGALKDLTDNAALKNIQPAYIDMIGRLAITNDNKVYGIPYATNANAIIYNKELFEKLGLTIPKTWDELVSTAEKIKAAGQTPFFLTLKDAWTGMTIWNSIASNLQPTATFIPLREQNKTTFKETHQEIAQKMLTLLNYGHKNNFGLGYNDGNQAFAQGKSVMYIQGNWAISEILKSNPNIKLGMFTFPVTNDESKNNLVSGVDVLFAVPEKSKHPEEALKFIEFMNRKEIAERYIKNQFAFSAIKDVIQNDEKVADLAPSFEQGKITSFSDHYYPSGMEVANLLQEFLNKKDINAFLTKLDSEWDKVKQR